MGSDKILKRYRREIQQINMDILKLLHKRFLVTKKIGIVKKRESSKVSNKEIEQESINGTDAYLIISSMETVGISLPEGMSTESKIWFAKDTEKCLQSYAELNNKGDITRTENPCGPTTVLGNTPGLSYFYLGNETVAVPAGTFNTEKIGFQGSVVYYMADGIPVPVKEVWGAGEESHGKSTYDLVAWS